MELHGFRRPDGSVGVRNHVVVLPVDDISNAACEAVAAKIEVALEGFRKVLDIVGAVLADTETLKTTFSAPRTFFFKWRMMSA